MPGVTSSSPASSLPELRRIRRTLTAASSKVAATRDKVGRAKAQGNTKAKTGECDESASSARRMSPPTVVDPELGNRRCSWITANSEPLYVAFHDEEWGVPVHDDRKLFELLTLSQALAELTWPVILSKREELSAMIDGLYNASMRESSDKKMNELLRSNGCTLLSEQKIRAVATNAKQMQKVVHEFGSFSNYCWSLVNHRPVTNGFRYARQVPSKTPKSEAMSKDMMRRGFRCVGPTTVYSFLQVAGIVNDHLSCCFRFQACSQAKTDEKDLSAERRSSSLSSEDSEIRGV